MGRTRRKRCRRNQFTRPLDHEENTINLKKFMTRNSFNDEIHLKLRDFPATGRGVSTLTALHENDLLIRVPYNLMITYTTLQRMNFLQRFTPGAKLTIQDLLTTFLVMERQKKDSFWLDYINSLPSKPPWLPSLLSEEHVESLPFDLKLAAKKSRRLLEESFTRVQRSIQKDWTCGCVLDWNLFTWGFILVNTRAVYVKPQVVCELCDSSSDILSDEPCMALCPFLDMFNHSYEARTRAELIHHQGELFYQLITLTSYTKYEQVFISYGDHDNVKLLIEYGFFIPGNCHDCISIQSEEVFKVLNLNLTDFQYKFICNHSFNKDLFLNETGPSFNLKAFLFIASKGNCGSKNFTPVVYSDNYPKHFLENDLVEMCRELLNFLLASTEDSLRSLEDLGMNSVVIEFLNYRKGFIQKVQKLCDKQWIY